MRLSEEGGMTWSRHGRVQAPRLVQSYDVVNLPSLIGVRSIHSREGINRAFQLFCLTITALRKSTASSLLYWRMDILVLRAHTT